MTLDFLQHDALGVAELIRRGETSAREAVEASIRRIEALNPRLNAVVHPMFDRALSDVEGSIPDGPFRGVPFLLKDLLAWCEGEPITSGSRLFKGWIPPSDSELTRRYRRSGLIIVGKTNTPEFGLVPFTESELLGTCRNPWNPDVTQVVHQVAAAVVASGWCPRRRRRRRRSIRIPRRAADSWAETDARPHRPDRLRVSQRGAIVEHVLTRSVRDSAAMLDAVSGPDISSYCAPPPSVLAEEGGHPPAPHRVHDQPMLAHVHPDCVKAVIDAARPPESLGHDVEDTFDIDRVPTKRF
jgi:amidase